MSFPYPEPPKVGRAKWIRRIIIGVQSIIFIIALVTTVVAGNNEDDEDVTPPDEPTVVDVYRVSGMDWSALEAYENLDCYDNAASTPITTERLQSSVMVYETDLSNLEQLALEAYIYFNGELPPEYRTSTSDKSRPGH